MPKPARTCDDVIDIHAYPGPIEWVNVQDGRWPILLTQPEDCEDLEDNISDFTKEEIVRAIARHEHFHKLSRGIGLIDMLATSSCRIGGWLEVDSTLPIDIGGGRVASGALCGLWARGLCLFSKSPSGN